MSDAPKAPPGWYPDEAGEARYWDGSQWLDLPAPPADGKSKVAASPLRRRKRAPIVVGVVLAVLLAAGGGLFIHKYQTEQNAAAEQAELEAQAKEEEAEAAALRRAEVSKANADYQKKKTREAAVEDIEASIEDMAREHIAEGLIEGPTVLDVKCTPVAGGSSEPLLQESTTFECFVSTEEFGDGTQSGHYYNAVKNWTTGTYTFGLGRP